MQSDSNATRPDIVIGTPVYHPAWSKLGHVVAIEAPTAKTYTIGGGGLQRDRLELVVVWDDDTISEVSSPRCGRRPATSPRPQTSPMLPLMPSIATREAWAPVTISSSAAAIPAAGG